jgi:hypothetical protein
MAHLLVKGIICVTPPRADVATRQLPATFLLTPPVTYQQGEVPGLCHPGDQTMSLALDL